MPVNPERKLAFIHIPRNGGTTIEHLMGVHSSRIKSGFGKNYNHTADLEFLFGNNLQHLGLFDILDLTKGSDHDYYWFSMIRCPEQRFISFICYMLKRPEALLSTKKFLGVIRTIFRIWFSFCLLKLRRGFFSIRSGRQVSVYSPHIQHLMPQTTYFRFGYSNNEKDVPDIDLYPFTEIGNISTYIKELDNSLPNNKIPNRSHHKPTPTKVNRLLIRLFTQIFYFRDYKLYKKVHLHWQNTGTPFRLSPLTDSF